MAAPSPTRALAIPRTFQSWNGSLSHDTSPCRTVSHRPCLGGICGQRCIPNEDLPASQQAEQMDDDEETLLQMLPSFFNILRSLAML